jgi:hypothetical protein
VWRRFELLQLPSVRTFQQHVLTTLSVRQALGFLSKTQLCEDYCKRPDDVDSHPDALIHKVSIFIQIQMSRRRSSWSGRAFIRYGNCVHQINRLDDHLDDRVSPFGCDSKQERISARFLESRSRSCPSGRPMTTVRTAHRFYQTRRSFEPSVYK